MDFNSIPLITTCITALVAIIRLIKDMRPPPPPAIVINNYCAVCSKDG